MGYTGFTKRIIQTVIDNYNPKSIIDLGAQQDYDQPNLPAPYIDVWYKGMGVDYCCIDLNGENVAMILDLSEPIKRVMALDRIFTLLVDAGTSEHIGKDGSFSWQAIYNCWYNKHNILQTEGIMVSENPKTGNWPGHGFNYYTKEFYRQLEAATDYHIILLDEHPAMGNEIDGWNVMCVMQKKSDKFPTLEEFMQFDLKQE